MIDERAGRRSFVDGDLIATAIYIIRPAGVEGRVRVGQEPSHGSYFGLFSPNLTPLSGLNWMGATAGFVLKKQGQTSKV